MAYRLENYLQNTNLPICEQVIHYYQVCEIDLNFTPSTMTGKISSINHFLRWSQIADIRDITTDVLMAYIRFQTEQGLKPRTINNRTKHILAMMRYYRDVEDIELLNFKDKKIKKQYEDPAEKRTFPREVIAEALALADREAWLLIKIAFDCGLRINELRSMRLRDLNGNELLVHGKGRKNRFAILSDEVMIRLQDWIKRRGVTDYIWESNYGRRRGHPKTTNALRKIMQKPFTSSGVYKMCPHELRYSYASDLLNLGASMRGIQRGMGHSSVKITELYLQGVNPGKEAHDLYDLKYSAEMPALR